MLIQKYSDIPKNLLTNLEKDLLVQRYVKNPLLVEGKKFDLRLYVLVKSFDPIEAYLANEGLARLCTDNYRMPTKENMKNMFMHLTNFSLNKNSENFVAPTENFQNEDNGSKRLMSSLWKALEEQGYDITQVKSKIIDTIRKTIITLEPYLLHYYHAKVENDHLNAKNFHILGVDILLDKKLNAWLMEINANPSLCMFIEKDPVPGEPEPEKVLSELDKFVKTKIIGEAFKIVSGVGNVEYDGTYEKILPVEDSTFDDYYIWNRATELFELMTNQGKQTDTIGQFQFQRLSRVPGFAKANQFFKADLDICFKNQQRKYDAQSLDLYAFFDAIESLCMKIYKDQPLIDALSLFLDEAIPFFEEQNK